MIFLEDSLSPELLSLPPPVASDVPVTAALVVIGTTVLLVRVAVIVLPPSTYVDVWRISDTELVMYSEYETGTVEVAVLDKVSCIDVVWP